MNSEDKVHIPQLIKLSASAVKTFQQCQKKYYFTYIQHAPKKQWEHFDLGNVCHKALEIFHNTHKSEGTKKKSLSKLMGYSFENARKEFPNVTDKIMSEAKSLLMIYLDTMKKHGMPNVQGCEISFNFSLDKDIMIRGFIDRVDILKDGTLKVMDYKTTGNVQFLDEFQLLVYGLCLKELNPDLNKFEAAYVLLKHGSKLKEYDFNLQDIVRVKKELIDYAGKIRTENVWSPIPTKLCNWCDFKDICPAQIAW